jgi:hypothetical protein
MKGFNKLCTPAKIYFAIAVIATIIALLNGFHMIYAFWKIIFAFIWTFVLGWLCKKGYTSISWFLVLLPYIFILLAMLNIYHVTEKERQVMRAIKLQGAYGQEAFIEGFGIKNLKETTTNKASGQQEKDVPNWMKKQEGEEFPIGQEEQGLKKIKKLESKPLSIKEETIIEDRIIVEEDKPIVEDRLIVEEDKPIVEDRFIVEQENPILEEDEIIIEEEPLLEDTPVSQTITSDNVVTTNNSPFGSLSYFLGG